MAPGQWQNVYYCVCVCLPSLTPSLFCPLLASISCRARTDRDCSSTKVQMHRSGGTYCSNREAGLKSAQPPVLTKGCFMGHFDSHYTAFTTTSSHRLQPIKNAISSSSSSEVTDSQFRLCQSLRSRTTTRELIYYSFYAIIL